MIKALGIKFRDIEPIVRKIEGKTASKRKFHFFFFSFCFRYRI